MKTIAAILVCILLSGCDRGELGKADGLILCDPARGDAYRVEAKAGQLSAVWPMPQANKLCTVKAES